jgi:hypothetical protein
MKLFWPPLVPDTDESEPVVEFTPDELSLPPNIA